MNGVIVLDAWKSTVTGISFLHVGLIKRIQMYRFPELSFTNYFDLSVLFIWQTTQDKAMSSKDAPLLILHAVFYSSIMSRPNHKIKIAQIYLTRSWFNDSAFRHSCRCNTFIECFFNEELRGGGKKRFTVPSDKIKICLLSRVMQLRLSLKCICQQSTHINPQKEGMGWYTN